MRIAVLVKPVPETTGGEQLGSGLRLDRTALVMTLNPNDAHAIEAALLSAETVESADVTLLSMAPIDMREIIRKAMAMGANRAVMVSDEALIGSCAVTTARVLAAALQRLQPDLVIAGADSSDGREGVVPAAVAAILDRPYVSMASQISVVGLGVRIQRSGSMGDETILAPTGAIITVTQAVGQPRYASLRNLIAARSRPIDVWSLADLGIDQAALSPTTSVVRVERGRGRSAARVVRGTPTEAATEMYSFLRERGFGN